MVPLLCLSPVNGAVYVEREVLSSGAGGCGNRNCAARSVDLGRAARVGTCIETETVFMNRADCLDSTLFWTRRKNTSRDVALTALGFYTT